MKQGKIGVCGVACCKCHKYIKKQCLGCQPNEFCPLPKCAKEKGVEHCFDCKNFPCKLNYEKGPIVSEMLDYWRK